MHETNDHRGNCLRITFTRKSTSIVIEGYYDQVPKGHVRVGCWVGNCEGYGDADATTSLNFVQPRTQLYVFFYTAWYCTCCLVLVYIPSMCIECIVSCSSGMDRRCRLFYQDYILNNITVTLEVT